MKTNTTKKGRIVESIVADLHKLPNVQVQQNVYLNVLGKSKRKREIDVLLTAEVAGYPVQIAIECKNETSPIGSPKIDAFIGKLHDVGIATNHGIYVSASRYTSGAIERAKEARVRTLILTGLTKEGLIETVANAFQSMVYLFLEVIRTKITNQVSSKMDSYDMLTYYNDKEEIVGILPDIIWQKWINGEISSIIGRHRFKINFQSDWCQLIKGEKHPAYPVEATVFVSAFLLSLTGKVNQLSLIDAASKKVQKKQVKVIYDEPEPNSHMVKITSEEDLQKHITKKDMFAVALTRTKLPRIRTGPLYWPPSDKAVKKLKEIWQTYEAGKSPDPRPISITEIEGTDISTIWEPFLAKRKNKK